MLIAGLALVLLGGYTHNLILWVPGLPLMIMSGLRFLLAPPPGADRPDEPGKSAVPRMWRGY